MERLARILASAPDAKVRDGADAVRLATRVCQASGFGHRPHLVTLAAAYAESGDFEKAVGAIEHAIKIATRAGETGVVRDLEADLLLYRAGRPSRFE